MYAIYIPFDIEFPMNCKSEIKVLDALKIRNLNKAN